MSQESESQILQRKIRTVNMRLLRNKWKQQNPNWQEEQNAKTRKRYAENQAVRQRQIDRANNWNKNNRERRNATRRKLYAKKKELQT